MIINNFNGARNVTTLRSVTEGRLSDWTWLDLLFLFLGRFKGYALVLYSNPSSSIQARHVLEGQEVKGHALDCDWLKYGIVESVSLHSKCLFVDELPPDYRDMGEFRKLFSVAVNPPYCQVIWLLTQKPMMNPNSKWILTLRMWDAWLWLLVGTGPWSLWPLIITLLYERHFVRSIGSHLMYSTYVIGGTRKEGNCP